MTSKGIGDVRRVQKDLGINQTGPSGDGPWFDTFQRRQEPEIPRTNDPLVKFVADRIRELENEPTADFPALYSQAAGPAAHRYAAHVRQDCVVFRTIVNQYIEAHALTAYEGYDTGTQCQAEAAVRAIAARWSKHRDYREEWSA